MRSSAPARVLLLGALLVAGAALPAAGQDRDDRPPPRQFPRATIAGITSDRADPIVNAVVLSATAAATEDIGAKPPRSLTLPPRNALQAARDFGEEDFELDLVVVSGVPGPETIEVARDYPSTVYVGVDQGTPCVSADGIPDPSGTCDGDAATLIRNYVSSDFAIDEAGYLAGIVAAAVSRSGRIGAIGGWPGCIDCNKYIDGFQRGVASIAPGATVEVAYLTDDHPDVANLDPETARAFAEAFIGVNQLDVVLAASGGGSPGVIQAACEAEILAIGTDVDRAREHQRLRGCIVTSAIRDYRGFITDAVYEMARAFREEEIFVGGGRRWDLSNEGVGLAPSYDLESMLPVELPTRLQDAVDGIVSGSVQTCSDPCGVVGGSDADPEASPAPIEDAAG